MKASEAVLLGAAFAALAALVPAGEAAASVSVAITWDALLGGSSAVVIGAATDQRSVWEGGRIYTYSRLHVDQALAGELHEGDEPWVRTMGGVVGDVGQIVDGEAALTVGRPSLLFVHHSTRDPDGTATPGATAFVVTARAQGQFGLYADLQQVLRVRKSSGLGAIVIPTSASGAPVLAGDVLHGRAVADTAKDIAGAWSRTHAR